MMHSLTDNYFTLLGFVPHLGIDAGQLKRTFLLKSREYHPDFFVNESQELQQQAILKTSLLNEAYKTLSDAESRLAYILKIHGVDTTGNHASLPQEFLFEMMDLNEAKETASSEEERQLVELRIQNLEKAIQQSLKPYSDRTDMTHLEAEDLKILKTAFLQNRYLLRLREQ